MQEVTQQNAVHSSLVVHHWNACIHVQSKERREKTRNTGSSTYNCPAILTSHADGLGEVLDLHSVQLCLIRLKSHKYDCHAQCVHCGLALIMQLSHSAEKPQSMLKFH